MLFVNVLLQAVSMILQRLQSIVVNYQKGLFKINFTLVMWSMGGMGDDVSGGCKKGPKPPVPCQHTHHTTLYPTLHTHQTVPLCIYTIPFHTACPAQCTPCSGLPVTNRTRQATNITIEDRWQGCKGIHIKYLIAAGEKNVIESLYRGGHVHLPAGAPARTSPAH